MATRINGYGQNNIGNGLIAYISNDPIKYNSLDGTDTILKVINDNELDTFENENNTYYLNGNNTTRTHSISCWINPYSLTSSESHILDFFKSGENISGVRITANESGVWKFVVNNVEQAFAYTPNPLTIGNDRHLVLSFDDTNFLKITVDNVFIGAVANVNVDGTARYRFFKKNAVRTSTGIVKEIRVYSKEITTEMISEIYEIGTDFIPNIYKLEQDMVISNAIVESTTSVLNGVQTIVKDAYKTIYFPNYVHQNTFYQKISANVTEVLSNNFDFVRYDGEEIKLRSGESLRYFTQFKTNYSQHDKNVTTGKTTIIRTYLCKIDNNSEIVGTPALNIEEYNSNNIYCDEINSFVLKNNLVVEFGFSQFQLTVSALKTDGTKYEATTIKRLTSIPIGGFPIDLSAYDRYEYPIIVIKAVPIYITPNTTTFGEGSIFTFIRGTDVNNEEIEYIKYSEPYVITDRRIRITSVLGGETIKIFEPNGIYTQTYVSAGTDINLNISSVYMNETLSYFRYKYPYEAFKIPSKDMKKIKLNSIINDFYKEEIGYVSPNIDLLEHPTTYNVGGIDIFNRQYQTYTTTDNASSIILQRKIPTKEQILSFTISDSYDGILFNYCGIIVRIDRGYLTINRVPTSLYMGGTMNFVAKFYLNGSNINVKFYNRYQEFTIYDFGIQSSAPLFFYNINIDSIFFYEAKNTNTISDEIFANILSDFYKKFSSNVLIRTQYGYGGYNSFNFNFNREYITGDIFNNAIGIDRVADTSPPDIEYILHTETSEDGTVFKAIVNKSNFVNIFGNDKKNIKFKKYIEGFYTSDYYDSTTGKILYVNDFDLTFQPDSSTEINEFLFLNAYANSHGYLIFNKNNTYNDMREFEYWYDGTSMWNTGIGAVEPKDIVKMYYTLHYYDEQNSYESHFSKLKTFNPLDEGYLFRYTKPYFENSYSKNSIAWNGQEGSKLVVNDGTTETVLATMGTDFWGTYSIDLNKPPYYNTGKTFRFYTVPPENSGWQNSEQLMFESLNEKCPPPYSNHSDGEIFEYSSGGVSVNFYSSLVGATVTPSNYIVKSNCGIDVTVSKAGIESTIRTFTFYMKSKTPSAPTVTKTDTETIFTLDNSKGKIMYSYTIGGSTFSDEAEYTAPIIFPIGSFVTLKYNILFTPDEVRNIRFIKSNDYTYTNYEFEPIQIEKQYYLFDKKVSLTYNSNYTVSYMLEGETDYTLYSTPFLLKDSTIINFKIQTTVNGQLHEMFTNEYVSNIESSVPQKIGLSVDENVHLKTYYDFYGLSDTTRLLDKSINENNLVQVSNSTIACQDYEGAINGARTIKANKSFSLRNNFADYSSKDGFYIGFWADLSNNGILKLYFQDSAGLKLHFAQISTTFVRYGLAYDEIGLGETAATNYEYAYYSVIYKKADNTVRVFKNGSLIGGEIVNGEQISSSLLYLNFLSQNSDTDIDEVRIYDTVLVSSDMTKLRRVGQNLPLIPRVTSSENVFSNISDITSPVSEKISFSTLLNDLGISGTLSYERYCTNYLADYSTANYTSNTVTLPTIPNKKYRIALKTNTYLNGTYKLCERYNLSTYLSFNDEQVVTNTNKAITNSALIERHNEYEFDYYVMYQDINGGLNFPVYFSNNQENIDYDVCINTTQIYLFKKDGDETSSLKRNSYNLCVWGNEIIAITIPNTSFSLTDSNGSYCLANIVSRGMFNTGVQYHSAGEYIRGVYDISDYIENVQISNSSNISQSSLFNPTVSSHFIELTDDFKKWNEFGESYNPSNCYHTNNNAVYYFECKDDATSLVASGFLEDVNYDFNTIQISLEIQDKYKFLQDKEMDKQITLSGLTVVEALKKILHPYIWISEDSVKWTYHIEQGFHDVEKIPKVQFISTSEYKTYGELITAICSSTGSRIFFDTKETLLVDNDVTDWTGNVNVDYAKIDDYNDLFKIAGNFNSALSVNKIETEYKNKIPLFDSTPFYTNGDKINGDLTGMLCYNPYIIGSNKKQSRTIVTNIYETTAKIITLNDEDSIQTIGTPQYGFNAAITMPVSISEFNEYIKINYEDLVVVSLRIPDLYNGKKIQLYGKIVSVDYDEETYDEQNSKINISVGLGMDVNYEDYSEALGGFLSYMASLGLNGSAETSVTMYFNVLQLPILYQYARETNGTTYRNSLKYPIIPEEEYEFYAKFASPENSTFEYAGFIENIDKYVGTYTMANGKLQKCCGLGELTADIKGADIRSPIYLHINKIDYEKMMAKQNSEAEAISYYKYEEPELQNIVMTIEVADDGENDLLIKIKNNIPISDNKNKIHAIQPICVESTNFIEVDKNTYDLSTCSSVIKVSDKHNNVEDPFYSIYGLTEKIKYSIVGRTYDSDLKKYYITVDKNFPTEQSEGSYICFDLYPSSGIYHLNYLSIRGNPIIQQTETIKMEDEVSTERIKEQLYSGLDGGMISKSDCRKLSSYLINECKIIGIDGLKLKKHSKFVITGTIESRFDLDVLDRVLVTENIMGLKNEPFIIIGKSINNTSGDRTQSLTMISTKFIKQAELDFIKGDTTDFVPISSNLPSNYLDIEQLRYIKKFNSNIVPLATAIEKYKYTQIMLGSLHGNIINARLTKDTNVDDKEIVPIKMNDTVVILYEKEYITCKALKQIGLTKAEYTSFIEGNLESIDERTKYLGDDYVSFFILKRNTFGENDTLTPLVSSTSSISLYNFISTLTQEQISEIIDDKIGTTTDDDEFIPQPWFDGLMYPILGNLTCKQVIETVGGITEPLNAIKVTVKEHNVLMKHPYDETYIRTEIYHTYAPPGSGISGKSGTFPVFPNECFMSYSLNLETITPSFATFPDSTYEYTINSGEYERDGLHYFDYYYVCLNSNGEEVYYVAGGNGTRIVTEQVGQYWFENDYIYIKNAPTGGAESGYWNLNASAKTKFIQENKLNCYWIMYTISYFNTDNGEWITTYSYIWEDSAISSQADLDGYAPQYKFNVALSYEDRQADRWTWRMRIFKNINGDTNWTNPDYMVYENTIQFNH